MSTKRRSPVHPAVPELREQLRLGTISRRDFLATATRLGLSVATAYALAGGLPGRRPVGTARAQTPQAETPQAETPQAGGVLRCSMNVKEMSDPATFDWSEKGNLARHLCEPLVRINKDNIAEPYLAERWEATEDLKTWTFHLRKGVTWSNGDDFIADDVVFNVARWLDPATGSSNQGRFSAMTEEIDTGKTDDQGNPIRSTVAAAGAVEKVDDHTVRFHLSRADISLPESFADYPALIVHRRFSEDGGDLAKTPVGTGPFMLTRFSVGELAEYRRRDDHPWWGGEVYLDGILYVDHGDDPGPMIAALASGQVDCNFRTSVEQVSTLRAIPNLVTYETVTAQTGVARMKVTETPFHDKRIRRAIQACMDHQKLLDLAHQGLGAPGEDHHVSPIHPEYAKLPPLKQDYALAKALLAEAGHADGLRVRIDCVANPVWEQTAVKVIAEMCRPAGITVDINVMPGGTYWDRWMTTPFGFTAWTHRALGIQTLNLAYRSGGAWNETSYANAAFDALLDEAGALLDPNARRAVMEKLQKMLQDDAIIVQPFWRSDFITATNKVHNIYAHVANEHHYNKVWLG